MSVLDDLVEKNIEDPRSKLIWLMIWLIKHTSDEAKYLVKNCINLTGEVGYETTIKLLRRPYGDPHQLLAAYRK